MDSQQNLSSTQSLPFAEEEPPSKQDLPSTLFRRKFYPETTYQDWHNWRWQVRNRLKTQDQLQHICPTETIIGSDLPFAITPYYASLLGESAIRKAMIPSPIEREISPLESIDPLGEDHQSPVEGIVHRYPDRVLFLVTDFCSANCRYCTRSRIIGQGQRFSQARFLRGLEYIQQHPEIRDVLISGGDPLTLSTERLEQIISAVRRIKHVEMIRIGTKVPAVLPMRITEKLCKMFKRYHPLYLSLHFMHPAELTWETGRACERLADAGIPLGSQTVLLKGINDDVDTMRQLFQGLLRVRVRPYYLYQCDPIQGSSHFRTDVAKGLEIIEGLRGHTSGYAIPHYVIDAPGGGGKIPLLPDYYQGKMDDRVILRNFEGGIYTYP